MLNLSKLGFNSPSSQSDNDSTRSSTCTPSPESANLLTRHAPTGHNVSNPHSCTEVELSDGDNTVALGSDDDLPDIEPEISLILSLKESECSASVVDEASTSTQPF